MPADPMISEPYARAIMRQALAQDRCADVLNCLLAGGSVALETGGRIVLVTAAQLSELFD